MLAIFFFSTDIMIEEYQEPADLLSAMSTWEEHGASLLRVAELRQLSPKGYGMDHVE